jgi:nicotinate-nucleotide adenylyltransferase
MTRLGLFGGTFDPVHLGHIRTLEAARVELDLPKVILLPNPFPPHKNLETITPYSHRKEMLRMAIAGNPALEIGSLEEESQGPAYTTDTVRRLLTQNPDLKGEIWLIIGADSLLDLPLWKDPEALFRDTKVAVLPRPGFDLNLVKPEFLSRVRILHTPLLEISARVIRQSLASNKSVDQLLSPSVLNYIRKNSLYKNP